MIKPCSLCYSYDAMPKAVPDINSVDGAGGFDNLLGFFDGERGCAVSLSVAGRLKGLGGGRYGIGDQCFWPSLGPGSSA